MNLNDFMLLWTIGVFIGYGCAIASAINENDYRRKMLQVKRNTGVLLNLVLLMYTIIAWPYIIGFTLVRRKQ